MESGHGTLVCRSVHFYAEEDKVLRVEISSTNQQAVLWSSIKPQNVTWEAKPAVKKVREVPVKPTSSTSISIPKVW